jgi:hypothetical protein
MQKQPGRGGISGGGIRWHQGHRLWRICDCHGSSAIADSPHSRMIEGGPRDSALLLHCDPSCWRRPRNRVLDQLWLVLFKAWEGFVFCKPKAAKLDAINLGAHGNSALAATRMKCFTRLPLYGTSGLKLDNCRDSFEFEPEAPRNLCF